MQNQTITPVQIIQELIAMLTTRKEACEKIAAKQDAGGFSGEMRNLVDQSDRYISQLQNELSAFGDAVMADVDRNNPYQLMWRKGLEMQDTASASELHQHFIQMEETLRKNYLEYTSSGGSLTDTLIELLKKQQQELNNK